MLYSRLFPRTLRQVPKEIASTGHRFLVQAGFIRSLSSGLFTFTSLGVRVLERIKSVMREEMDALGGQEVLTPLVNPIDIWRETGRDEMLGMDMVRFRDRAGRMHVLAPTSEEAVTDLVRHGLRSYRDLPLFFYQFQTKYRDEKKTRCGLVRTREFVMQDGYSYHRSFADLNNFFPRISAAYGRIFQRLGVPYVLAEAGVGYMAGDRSYEFLLPCECGDDHLMQCDSCGYSANVDVARGVKEPLQEAPLPMESVPVGDATSMVDVCERDGIERNRFVKAMLFQTTRNLVMAVVRGDHEVSPEKLTRVLEEPVLGPATKHQIKRLRVPIGFLSPVSGTATLPSDLTIVVDDTFSQSSNLVAGGNDGDEYFVNVNFGRDFDAPVMADIARVPENSLCIHCSGGRLRQVRAMELGNIFRLGDYYSKRMGLRLAEDDNTTEYVQMGSYGIGLGRVMAAVVEANHDDRGIIWPPTIAPYDAYLMSIGSSRSTSDAVHSLHEELGDRVLFDDRHESISYKLKDADLLGLPYRIIVGRDSLSREMVEVHDRRTGETWEIPRDNLSAHIGHRGDV